MNHRAHGENRPFAAVLLAGGQSRRMGQDKALLRLPDGRRLWERQLATLRGLEPEELFISGPVREGFPADVKCLADEVPGRGPLGGIVPALDAMRSERLVVLAVDLPAMTAGFLRALLMSESGEPALGGVIPQTSGGFFEPLAAVYPKTALTEAQARLRGGDLSLQRFIRRLVETGEVVARAVLPREAALFANWNQPDDLIT